VSTGDSIQNSLAVGVDVGGTKVAAGLVNHEGAILSQTRVPMASSGTAAEGLSAITSAVDSLLAKDPQIWRLVRGIGICSPGPLDPATGVVLNPPNLPCWRNFPLAQQMSQIYSVPVKVDNDANAAALAEAQWGAGRGYENVFYATVGTGIGSGIIFDGQIYHGHTGAAAEGGHVSIDYHGPLCACGKRGCIEVLAAGPAIARRACAKIAADASRGTALLALAGGELVRVTSELVAQAYAAGDSLSAEILQDTAELISFWLGNVVDLLDPAVIIIGGGVAVTLQPFFVEIHSRMASYSINPRASQIPLLPARYGADSGIAGGAALV
jgi:glucokinase